MVDQIDEMVDWTDEMVDWTVDTRKRIKGIIWGNQIMI